MKKYLYIILFLTLPPLSHVTAASIPFRPGEKIIYSLRWANIKAGQLILEIAPTATVKGKKCWHFVMIGKTSGLVDVFYKVRDRVDAYTDLAITHSVFYAKKSRGSKQKDEQIDFFWDRQEAQYSKNGRIRKTVKIQPGTFDPLSIFYFFRLEPLRPGQIIRVPISDGKKCVIGQGKVVRRQRIQIGKNSFDSVLVIPDLKQVGGAFRHGKGSQMKMWFTSDALHIPVKVETKVKIGTLHLELESIRTGTTLVDPASSICVSRQ